MTLKQCILTANDCYKKGQKITGGRPSGIVVHSTGANNKMLKRYVQPLKTDKDAAAILADIGTNANGNHWNRGGRSACVHAFIGVNAAGKVETYQTLPFDLCCWGVGSGSKGSYNYNPQARIQFEICEDGLADQAYFDAAFREAAEFCAYLCKEYGFGADKICSHKEAHAQGYGSNHGDCDHWLAKFGQTMDWFREEVGKLLAAPAAPATETVYTVVKGDTLSGIAARYGTTWQALAEYNGIANPSLIHAGQKIRIPGASGGSVQEAPTKPQKPRTYTVVSGDSLSKIGGKLGVSWRKIAQANGIQAPWVIRPGQVLTIPEA